VKIRGGKRTGSGRKKKPVHLKRNPVTIRLPQFMILRLKQDGEIGYLIEEQLAKNFENCQMTMISTGAFAFPDNKLKNEKNVVFNLEFLAFYCRPALILLNNGACSP
jgi:hypothetical protein